MLADVLGRDGAELSASETRQRNLANADYLGTLNAIWTAETRGAQDNRYCDLVMATLPPGYRQPLSHQARWLFRTLRAAELAAWTQTWPAATEPWVTCTGSESRPSPRP